MSLIFGVLHGLARCGIFAHNVIYINRYEQLKSAPRCTEMLRIPTPTGTKTGTRICRAMQFFAFFHREQAPACIALHSPYRSRINLYPHDRKDVWKPATAVLNGKLSIALGGRVRRLFVII
jgi:hypothetical protein